MQAGSFQWMNQQQSYRTNFLIKINYYSLQMSVQQSILVLIYYEMKILADLTVIPKLLKLNRN